MLIPVAMTINMLRSACKRLTWCFLRNIANGELDNRQINWINKLSAQQTGPDILFIMTRIDECSQEHIEQTVSKIQQQVENYPHFLISSQRYMNGIATKQARLQELSGILIELAL